MRKKTDERIPTELAAALSADKRARAFYAAMPPSHQREFAKFVGEAKKTEARKRRAGKAVKMVLAWGERRG